MITIKKYEKEVIQYQLDSEKAMLKELEKQYKAALDSIDDKIASLLGRNDSNLQNVIFQVEHQKALKRQVEGILDQLHSNQFDSISDYLAKCYESGFVGSMYSMHNQGVQLILPLDQKAVTKAVVLDSKISAGLYNSLGVDANKLKKSIQSEITRGISAGMSYNEIARNISNATKAPLSRAKSIVYTEGHRVQQASNFDGQLMAKSKGAEVVKQWSSTLDGSTRDSHRKLDGQIREIEEPFEVDGMEAMFPGDFGDPAEDCNCRCLSTTRAKVMLDEDELQRLKDRAEYFGLDKTKDFEDFQNKYLKAAEESEEQFGVIYGDAAKEVDWDYINSADFEEKFSTITEDQEANKRILEISKSVLKHCDGTDHEDMYLLGMDGKVISKVTDSVSRLGINYSDEFKEALNAIIENNTPVVALHNHPHGTPPSPDDFRKAYENKYTIGMAIGHNGQVYVYTNENVEISFTQADQIADDIEFLYRMGWDIDRASKKVYDDYGLNYTVFERGYSYGYES